MRLFSKLFGKGEVDGMPRPDAVPCDGAPDVVYAPASGMSVAMADIPDPVFASGAMGPALGIKPSEGIIYAPVAGEVTVTTPTLHALGIASYDGIELLIHIGVDTVQMKGEGFHSFVEKGSYVRAGEPLVVFDLGKVAEAGHDDTVITVVTNADQFAEVRPLVEAEVTAGGKLMSVLK